MGLILKTHFHQIQLIKLTGRELGVLHLCELAASGGGGEVKAAAGPGAVHDVISRCHQSRGGQLGTRRGLDRRDHAAQIIRITRANYYDYKHYAACHHDY